VASRPWLQAVFVDGDASIEDLPGAVGWLL